MSDLLQGSHNTNLKRIKTSPFILPTTKPFKQQQQQKTVRYSDYQIPNHLKRISQTRDFPPVTWSGRAAPEHT